MSGLSLSSGNSHPDIPGLEIGDPIGRGGAGTVYRATHRSLDRTVAVKILHRNCEVSWLRESRTTASLTHSNVVTIHDAGQVDGVFYLIVEYLDGGSLRTQMEPGRAWPLSRAIRILDSIAAALEFIHSKGVLHLDLKPENILLQSDGVIKISDFGISLEADSTALREGRNEPRSLDYAAPERLNGQSPDVRYDVFSLSTLAYELLTGRLPGRVYVPASRRNRLLPKSIDALLERGLAREPENRHTSMTEFRNELANTLDKTRFRFGSLAILIVFLAGIAAIGIWALQSESIRPNSVWVISKDDRNRERLCEDAVASGLRREQIAFMQPSGAIPRELRLGVWPSADPVVVIQSPGATGFVCPITDLALPRKVLESWSHLLGTSVPRDKNFVFAGDFDGECLVTRHRGDRWRVGDDAFWNPDRNINVNELEQSPPNRYLELTYLDPVDGLRQLGCYQPLAKMPSPGSTVVIRFRAKWIKGSGSATVYAQFPFDLLPSDQSDNAQMIRRNERPFVLFKDDPVPNRWVFRVSLWLQPSTDWETYLIVFDCPPYPTVSSGRNLVIDVSLDGQVRIDDVEMWAWSESKS